MAVAYTTVTQPGLLSQQYPPPLLPKPGKDNVRLQKLLKRTAKKKASAQASQSAAPFRSSLSPVNEASPDLEHSDHSTPPHTPETPFSLYIQQPPRFTVRPLYQHVASPYPHRAAYGRAVGLSPQTVGTASYSYSQQVSTVSSYSTTVGVSPAAAPVTQPAVPKISLPTSSVPEATVPAAEVRKPAFSTYPAAVSPGQTPYPVTGGQAVIQPLTVLTPLGKSKSPRPTFRATEPSRSPKPMFDVPQIRMYTASTSYYETSRTPPVYDTSGLTSIGSTVPHSKTDTKRDLTPTSELRRGTTPTAQPLLMGTDSQRKTPTLEVKRGTTPTGETNRVITPTTEMKRATPTSEGKRATPTSEIRVKTPNFEFQISRTSAGRPKTPAYHVTRATTPVFEISRPNPLLFAISPITVEPERSRTAKTVSAVNDLSLSQSVKTTELKPPETMLNGDIHSVVTPAEIPAAKPIQQSITKSKSEPDLTRAKISAAPVGSQTPKPRTSEPTLPAVTPYGYQRPKTPTYEASRLITAAPGYKRPKTPTYGTPSSGVSPVGFQRPKTPTQVAHKSSYRGLTPAEYAAHGGIKTHSPAYGILSSMTQEEVKTTKEEPAEDIIRSQDVSVKSKVSKVKETPKDADAPHLKDEKVSTISAIPTIVVSQASDTSGTTLTQEKSTVTSQVAEKTVTQETPKAKPPKQEEKPSEKQKVETPAKEVAKPKTKSPEVTQPLPKGGGQDPLKAVRKLLGKDKVQTTEQKAGTETKAKVSEPKEATKPSAETKADGSKPTALPAVEPKASDNKGKDKKAESVSAAKSTPEKKEEGESALAAEPLLKVIQKPKGMKSKLSGWSRLKKHMVVEQEEPKFPELGSQKETTGLDQSEDEKVDETAGEKTSAQDENQAKDAPKATKMWDAVLFQMFSTKENIMHQIELNKSEEEKKEETNEELLDIPSFAYRLPVLLFSPKFDAKKLKEAASRPVTKMSTVFEMGMIGRKGKEEEPKDFNRTARGFTGT